MRENREALGVCQASPYGVAVARGFTARFIRGVAAIASLAAAVPAAAHHGIAIDPASIEVCQNGAAFVAHAIDADSLGVAFAPGVGIPVLVADVVDGTTRVASGAAMTFGTLGESRRFVVAYPAGTLAPGATAILGLTDVSGEPELTDGTQGWASHTALLAPAASACSIALAADLAIAKSHTGSFAAGDTGRAYTIVASNVGSGPTSGSVGVVDTLPAGLAAAALAGPGWSCTLATLTCTRSDALAAGSSYPPITLTVDVAPNAPASVTNTVAVSGGNDSNPANNTASDVTAIGQWPDLAVGITRAGPFSQGQVGAAYTIVVSNAGLGASAGVVTVADALPAKMTATAMGGSGWTCALATLVCTRSDALAPGASYPAITLTVDIAIDAATTLANTATVSGGGDVNPANNTASDATTLAWRFASGTIASGAVTARLDTQNGGASCGFANAAWLPLSSVPALPPAGVTFPHGLFEFDTTACTPGFTMTLTLTYPPPVGTSYLKFGPTPDAATPHWYAMAATFAGNTVSFSITDGGRGDDTGIDGRIVDQGGPIVVVSAVPVPTLGDVALRALGALLLAFGLVHARRRVRAAQADTRETQRHPGRSTR